MYECFLPSNHYYGYGSLSTIVILSDEIIEFMKNHKLKIKLGKSGKDHKVLSRQEALDDLGIETNKPYISDRDKFIVYGEDRDSILLFRLSF